MVQHLESIGFDFVANKYVVYIVCPLPNSMSSFHTSLHKLLVSLKCGRVLGPVDCCGVHRCTLSSFTPFPAVVKSIDDFISLNYYWQ